MKAVLKVVVAAALAVVGLAIYHRPRQAVPGPSPEQSQLFSAAHALRPRLPAPCMPVVVSPPVESPTADPRPANVFKRLFEGGQFPPVSRLQLEP